MTGLGDLVPTSCSTGESTPSLGSLGALLKLLRRVFFFLGSPSNPAFGFLRRLLSFFADSGALFSSVGVLMPDASSTDPAVPFWLFSSSEFSVNLTIFVGSGMFGGVVMAG